MKYIAGVDSGKQGCFSVIGGKEWSIIETHLMPLKDKDLDLDALRELIIDLEFNYSPLFVLEQLQPIYGAGKSSMWSMCNTYSIIVGMLHALGVNYVLIPAKKWQKLIWKDEDVVYKDPGKKKTKDTKATSTAAVKRLYPLEHEKLIYSSDEKITGRRNLYNSGIVDSILIARSQIDNI
jgi:hypothetical protein